MVYNKLFQALILSVFLSSCASRTSSQNYVYKYNTAVTLYQAKKYTKALEMLKEVMPMLKGKKEMIQAQFYFAYALFYEKSYKSSAHFFEQFYKTYPRVDQVEEALYMQGYSLYLASEDLRLDQSKTQKSLKILLLYLNKYPDGAYKEQANKYINLLTSKLALKAFNNAKLYYQLEHYKATVVELINFQQQYPGSIYEQEALYIKAKAQYYWAQQLETTEQLDKLLIFVDYYHELLDHYPDTKFAKQLQNIYTIALEKIDNFVDN